MADEQKKPKKVYTGDGEYEEQTTPVVKKPIPESVKKNTNVDAQVAAEAVSKEKGQAIVQGSKTPAPKGDTKVGGGKVPVQGTNPNAGWVPPVYHKGVDKVPNTGTAVLKKGEAVLNTQDASTYRDMKDKMGKHLALASTALGGTDKPEKPAKHIKEIRVRKGKNGGHIIEHHHTRPEHHPMEEHVAADTKTMLEHMSQHMGDADDAGGQEEAEPAQQSATEAMAKDVGF